MIADHGPRWSRGVRVQARQDRISGLRLFCDQESQLDPRDLDGEISNSK